MCLVGKLRDVQLLDLLYLKKWMSYFLVIKSAIGMKSRGIIHVGLIGSI